jgi:hypothetical protein
LPRRSYGLSSGESDYFAPWFVVGARLLSPLANREASGLDVL